ncbi:MAG: prepilin-type N-terminal cleavage/methylation domain-containing protein [Akkermansiaceae bacterium]|nr:prepilin-type N-terminal cleavage/methylation domain-containing protein [Akkermansiaceae bacterium]
MNLLRLAGSTAPSGRIAPRRVGGFTLVEVLTVIAIIAILLGITVAAMGPSDGPRARRAARDAISAMLTRARSEAVSSGNPTAVAFVGLGDGPEESRGRAMTLYEVVRDEVTGDLEAGDQLRRWTKLPGRTILLTSEAGAGDPDRALNALDQPPALEVRVPEKGKSRPSVVQVPCIVFEPTGAVSHPAGSGRIGIHVGEGAWRNETLLITARKDSGAPLADTVYLSRLTGRARSLEGDNR